MAKTDPAKAMRIGWKPKSDDPRVASVRFRCLTPLRMLQKLGFPIELFDPSQANAYTLVIFSKLYGAADQELARKLQARGCKTALDVSDNHFYNPGNLPEYVAAGADLSAMAGIVDRVICCSDHLATVMTREAKLSLPPLVVGDAVEEYDLPLDARSPFAQPAAKTFRVLWFGSHGSPNAPAGMEDLLRIRRHLETLAQQRRSELIVLSNSTEKFKSLSGKMPIPSRYREWTPESFMQEMGRAHLVIIPVTPNPFTKCKSNNRLATALWFGVPVVADRIPAYDEFAEFAILDDWERGFKHAGALSRDLELRTLAGSSYVRTRFNTRQIAIAWRLAIKMVGDQPATTKSEVS
jgi:hypothetical protein